MLPGRFKQVQGPHRIDVKIVERAILREIVRRLRGTMNYRAEPVPGEKIEDRHPVANVERVVSKALHLFDELLQPPGRITLRTEKISAHVVVEAVDATTATEPMRPLDPVTRIFMTPCLVEFEFEKRRPAHAQHDHSVAETPGHFGLAAEALLVMDREIDQAKM